MHNCSQPYNWWYDKCRNCSPLKHFTFYQVHFPSSRIYVPWSKISKRSMILFNILQLQLNCYIWVLTWLQFKTCFTVPPSSARDHLFKIWHMHMFIQHATETLVRRWVHGYSLHGHWHGSVFSTYYNNALHGLSCVSCPFCLLCHRLGHFPFILVLLIFWYTSA